MKLFNQLFLAFLASSFCFSIHAQTLPTNDCVQTVSDALKILERQPLTKTDVISPTSNKSE